MLLRTETYKTLDDLNQDEMGGLRINPTNISSTVTYMNNIKLRKINDKMKLAITCQPIISNISWSTNEKKIAFHILQIQVELYC
jgi:hypothetical protein